MCGRALDECWVSRRRISKDWIAGMSDENEG